MPQNRPRTLLIRTAGTNCDRELAFAFELAGAATATLHVKQLADQPQLLQEYDIIALPGGFSYGDDIAAGRILANRLRHRLYEPLYQAVQRGVPIIGICNGFQVLVKLGLLPEPLPPGQVRQMATLADNLSGRFIDRWVGLQAQSDSTCIWTRGLDCLELPIAHGEGRFVPADNEMLARWQQQKQIALRYDAARGNPNGSVDDIAGICDPSGLILGLMPHPERYVTATQHPAWTRFDADEMEKCPPGLRLLRNAVEHVQNAAVTAA